MDLAQGGPSTLSPKAIITLMSPTNKTTHLAQPNPPAGLRAVAEIQQKLLQGSRELRGLTEIGIYWFYATPNLQDILTPPWRSLSKLIACGAHQRLAPSFAQSPSTQVGDANPTWFHDYFASTTEGPGV